MGGLALMIPILALMIPIVAILSRSTIGHAIADAIRHNSGASEGASARLEVEQLQSEVEQLRGDVEQLNSQLLEVHERLDFAERLLARGDAPSEAKE
jgi:hypothetical protein